MYSHALLAMVVALTTTTTHVLTFPTEDHRIPQEYNIDLSQETPTPVHEDYLYEYMTEDDEEEQDFRRILYDTLVPTIPSRDPLADAREMARLNIMDRILIALGPPFGDMLPKAPTNDTLATVPTPINITAEPCPYKYKRCSSQTFFPSCDIPRNTDPEIWPQRFNLYFNLSADFDSKLDVINATLRLFKNSSLPLQSPKTLLIKAYVYTKSLTRRRAKTTLVADAQVSSDYLGWVSLPVDKMVRRWKRARNNYGLLITVNDIDQILWDAPRLFVIMDCASGLVPLPFEVQTDEEGQRYPALNVRLGSPDDEGEVNLPSPSPAPVFLPEGVTVVMQSDDPTVTDSDMYVPQTSHHHLAVSSQPTTLIHMKNRAHANSNEGMHAHGMEHSFGNGHNMAGSEHAEGNNQRLIAAQPHGHNHHLTNSHVLTTSPTHTNHQDGHGMASHYVANSEQEEFQHDVVTEIYPRYYSTQATFTANGRSLSLGERGSSGERGSPFERGSSGERGSSSGERGSSSGERGSWSQRTPATDETRSQRQRGASKERRHRKKHRSHQRRG